jgi:hypothetical protein
MKTIIGIDGGKSGAIAISNNGSLKIHKMPPKAVGIANLLQEYDPEDTVVFIEKVSAFVGEDAGKKYAIIKMLEQVKSIKVVLELYGFTYIEIASQTWQKNLGLKFKGLEKSERKTKYWEFAKRFAPKNQIFKYAGDAVCILACGIKLIKIEDPLVNDGNNQADLF